MRRIISVLLICLFSTAAWAGGASEPASSTVETDVRVKNVILFIADGMAIPQLSAAEAYLHAVENAEPGQKLMALSRLEAQGMTTTYDAGRFITDSASAGTAMATGHKTVNAVISMDPSGTVKYPTIGQMAKAAGMKAGIVSSVNLDHATPAVFYAHSPSRNDYYGISMQLAHSNFDFFGGGMVRIDRTPAGEKNAHDIMQERGWTIASNRQELMAVNANSGQIYAYTTGFAGNALDYAIDQDPSKPTLADFTKKALEVLDNDNGFFLMVEGGKIDWACHANDAAASIHDTIAFDDAVKVAFEFYNRNLEDTIIIVTGDHETGGMALGFAGTQYESAFSYIANQTMSHEKFNHKVFRPFREQNPQARLQDLYPAIESAFGISDFSAYETRLLERAFSRSMGRLELEKDEAYLLYGGYEPITIALTHIVNNRAGIGWTSYAHTGVPVTTFAQGRGSELFNGYYDNTDMFFKMAQLLGLKESAEQKTLAAAR